MLMWNSYGFSPKIKAKDLLEIVYVTSTIYMIHYNVPTVVSVCILFSVYQNLGYFEITLSLNLSLRFNCVLKVRVTVQNGILFMGFL